MENSDQLTGIISDVALSFIVQEPRGIMALSNAISLSPNFLMYLNISVSVWNCLKILCSRKSDILTRFLGIDDVLDSFKLISFPENISNNLLISSRVVVSSRETPIESESTCLKFISFCTALK